MPALPKNIYRTEYGYRVSIQRHHKLHVKYFSHLQYGTLSAALSAAKQYLAGLKQNTRLHLLPQPNNAIKK